RWTPLIYQYRNLGFDEIVPLYKACDIAMITPLRDGMNLVAKEFVASRTDGTGVLILSEMAGAVKEMGEALVINPFHVDDFVWALERAMKMPVEEQQRRMHMMQERLQRYDVTRWAGDFVHGMVLTGRTEADRRVRVLSGKAQEQMVEAWRG
ncbi:MAG: trehalose-6-phosphate synthase, partial [Gammaproteobacteria bacterium]